MVKRFRPSFSQLYRHPEVGTGPVDIRTARSKAAFLGRQPFNAVPARSTAQVEILVLPPCSSLLWYMVLFVSNLYSLLLHIFIFVFNICSFLLYVFRFYSIFDHLYSISGLFRFCCALTIEYKCKTSNINKRFYNSNEQRLNTNVNY